VHGGEAKVAFDWVAEHILEVHDLIKRYNDDSDGARTTISMLFATFDYMTILHGCNKYVYIQPTYLG
jgi:hypothetical protein